MKYLKTLIYEFIILISFNIITTILYYFNIIGSKTNNILNIIIFIITFFFSGVYISKKSNKKYYLEGIKISLINILLFILISFITKYNFNIKQILYYIFIILITTLGSIVKGNLKKR